jgi:hypothetical protein
MISGLADENYLQYGRCFLDFFGFGFGFGFDGGVAGAIEAWQEENISNLQ